MRVVSKLGVGVVTLAVAVVVGGSGPATRAKASPVTTPTTMSAAQRATAAGCAHIRQLHEPIATGIVSCIVSGREVKVATFATNADRDRYIATAPDMPGIEPISHAHVVICITGDRWMAMTAQVDIVDLNRFGRS
jgi:hypothetical protein